MTYYVTWPADTNRGAKIDFGAGTSALVASGQTIGSGSYASITVASGQTLYINSMSTIYCAGIMTVDGTVVIGGGGNTSGYGIGEPGCYSYDPNSPGHQGHDPAEWYTNGAGGGYAVAGGEGTMVNYSGTSTQVHRYGGVAYDSLTYAAGVSVTSALALPMCGSRGGTSNNGGGGGAGGGGVKIWAGSLVVSGTIRSDGGDGNTVAYVSGYYGNSQDGPGSGGGIWLVAGRISGAGTLRCMGGSGSNNGPAGTGGGSGRVRIDYAMGDTSGLSMGTYGTVASVSRSIVEPPPGGVLWFT